MQNTGSDAAGGYLPSGSQSGSASELPTQISTRMKARDGVKAKVKSKEIVINPIRSSA